LLFQEIRVGRNLKKSYFNHLMESISLTNKNDKVIYPCPARSAHCFIRYAPCPLLFLAQPIQLSLI
jgi:hypothetical protein